MKTYRNRIIFRIMKGVSSLRWGTDAIPRLFDRISNFPHPRDALACFFFCALVHLRLNFKSVSLGTNTGGLQCVMCEDSFFCFLFFLHSKKKILTLERGGKKKKEFRQVDRILTLGHHRVAHYITHCFIMPSILRAIHSFSINIHGSKDQLHMILLVIYLINFLNHVN